MISFTTMSVPAFVGLSLLVAGVLALLQYLRIRPRRRHVITTLFWQQASEQVRARSLFERFRHLYTYLFLLAIALLVLLSLAKPVTDAGDQPYRVIVLEAGISMTTDDGRFEDALKLVRDEARRTSEERVAVIVADPQPRMLKHFDESIAVLDGRLDRLTAADQPVARADVLRIADTILGKRPNGEVVLVAAMPAERRDANVRVLAAGAAIENAAVIAATFVPSPNDPTVGSFHWRVGFSGTKDGAIIVQLTKNEETLLKETIKTQAGEVRAFEVGDVAADGGTLTISLSGSDSIRGDSIVEYRTPDRKRIHVDFASTNGLSGVLKSIVGGLPGISIERPGTVDAPVLRVGSVAGNAEIAIQPVKTSGELKPVSVASHPLTAGLVFEDALCRPPTTPLTSGVPLLLAGGHPVAVLDEARNRIVVADTLLDKRASVVRRTAYAVFWSRVMHRLSGWGDTPLTLSPSLATLPEFVGLEKTVLKADMSSVNRLAGAATEAAPEGTPTVPLWQLLLGCALALLILEATLNIRGRIA